jgi:hypothetical protein
MDLKTTSQENLIFRDEVQLLYEPAYVIPSVGNLKEEKSCVRFNFPMTYEHRKYTEIYLSIPVAPTWSIGHP